MQNGKETIDWKKLGLNGNPLLRFPSLLSLKRLIKEKSSCKKWPKWPSFWLFRQMIKIVHLFVSMGQLLNHFLLKISSYIANLFIYCEIHKFSFKFSFEDFFLWWVIFKKQFLSKKWFQSGLIANICVKSPKWLFCFPILVIFCDFVKIVTLICSLLY